MISASSLDRIIACPASACLPQERTESEAARRGTIIHGFLCDLHEMDREEALSRVPEEHLASCEAIDITALPACDPTTWRAEVALAYDVSADTGRVLGQMLDRRYEVADGEIPGTTDVIGVTEDRVIVFDYKTGHGDVAPAYRNSQIKFYALAAARAYGKSEAQVVIIRVRPGYAPSTDSAVLSAYDLGQFALQVQEAWAAVAKTQEVIDGGKVPTVTSGSHCRYCPAMAYCPARSAIVGAVLPGPESAEASINAGLTPERAAIAWKQIQIGQAMLDRVRGAILGYAEMQAQPIELGEGLTLGPSEVQVESVDAVVANEVLRTELGAEVAMDAVTLSASKSSIRRALRPVAKDAKVPLAELERNILGRIRAAKGITAKVSVRVQEMRAPLAESK